MLGEVEETIYVVDDDEEDEDAEPKVSLNHFTQHYLLPHLGNLEVKLIGRGMRRL